MLSVLERSTERRNYLVGVEIEDKKWQSILEMDKKEQCVMEVRENIWFRQRMKQTFSYGVGVQKRSFRENRFLLLEYDFFARRLRP